MTSKPQFLLASSSPRRAELLDQIKANFHISAVNIPEMKLAHESPQHFVKRLALQKAQAGFDGQDGVALPTLGADTAVVLGSRIFGKPTDEEDAVKTLLALSATTHQVLSAVAMVDETRSEAALVETLVTFRRLSEQECRHYWQTGEPADKAGAYGIQGLAAVFVSKISGSYSNVVGLPLTETFELLRRFGIDCWHSDAGGG